MVEEHHDIANYVTLSLIEKLKEIEEDCKLKSLCKDENIIESVKFNLNQRSSDSVGLPRFVSIVLHSFLLQNNKQFYELMKEQKYWTFKWLCPYMSKCEEAVKLVMTALTQEDINTTTSGEEFLNKVVWILFETLQSSVTAAAASNNNNFNNFTNFTISSNLTKSKSQKNSFIGEKQIKFYSPQSLPSILLLQSILSDLILSACESFVTSSRFGEKKKNNFFFGIVFSKKKNI